MRRALLASALALASVGTALAWQPRKYGVANGYTLAPGQSADLVGFVINDATGGTLINDSTGGQVVNN